MPPNDIVPFRVARSLGVAFDFHFLAFYLIDEGPARPACFEKPVIRERLVGRVVPLSGELARSCLNIEEDFSGIFDSCNRR